MLLAAGVACHPSVRSNAQNGLIRIPNELAHGHPWFPNSVRSPNSPGASITIPVEILAGTLLIRGSIRGRPISAVFDTGCARVILTPHLVRALHLPIAEEHLTIEGSTGATHRGLSSVHIDRLEIGGAPIVNQEALVDDLALLESGLGVPVDAIIGAGALRDQLVTVDYDRKQIVVEGGEIPVPDGVEILPATWSAGIPYVRLMVSGHPVMAVVDSGSSGGFALPSSLQKDLAFFKQPVPGHLAWGLTGTMREMAATIDGSIEVGRYHFDTPPVTLWTGDTSIGWDILRHFVVTLDAAHQRVRFARLSREAILLAPDRTGGFGVRKRDGHWIVADLIPNVESAAAIHLDDLILSVNGVVADTLTRDDWNRLLEGSVLRVSIMRGTEKLQVEVPVVELPF